MALGSLQRVIEKLQKTIEAHRGYLAENETRTRQVLIDPLLQKLGWNVSNPNIVQLEYQVREGRPDYALMSKGKPVAVVEAKRLGSDLDEVITQAFNYANPDGIDYIIVTDGDKWEMYDVFKKARLEERLLMKLELSQQLADKNAEQAWAMRKPNLTAKKPDFKPPKRVSKRDKAPKPPKLPRRNWYSLDSGKRYPPDTKPSRLKIGDSVDVEVNFWLDVIHEVVTWLINEEKLSEQHCPILIGKRVKRTFIDRKGGVNPDGTTFEKTKPLPNGLILQRGHHNLPTWDQWSKLKELLDQFDVDKSTIEVFYDYRQKNQSLNIPKIDP